MFYIWTKIPLGRKTKSGIYRINITEGTVVNIDSPLDCDNNSRLKSLEQLNIFKTTLIKNLLTSELIFGVIESGELDKIDLTGINNGVVIVTDLRSTNIALNNDLENKDKLFKMVQVLPLNFYAGAMRWPIKPPELFYSNNYDFRIYYFYGLVPHVDTTNIGYYKNILRRLETKLYLLKDSSNVRKLWYHYANTKMHLIYNGKQLVPSDYCLTCERRVEWSLGLCSFGKYNCILGTDLIPNMLNAPSPCLDLLFNKNSYVIKNDCVFREDFSSWSTKGLRDRNNIFVKEIDNYRKQDLAKARINRSLISFLCKSCVLGSSKSVCKSEIKSCKGPYFFEDFENIVNSRRLEPWKYHVLMLSRTSISIENIRRFFPALSKKTRLDVRVVCPVDAKDLLERERWSAAIRKNRKNTICSIGTKLPGLIDNSYINLYDISNRLVSLNIIKIPFRQLIISYEELCRVLNRSQCLTEEALFNNYPNLKQMSLEVIFSVYSELNIFKNCDRLLGYELSNNLFRRYMYYKPSYCITLSTPQALSYYIAKLTLSDSRTKENKMLHNIGMAYLTKHLSLKSLLVSEIIQLARSVGVEHATSEFLRGKFTMD